MSAFLVNQKLKQLQQFNTWHCFIIERSDGEGVVLFLYVIIVITFKLYTQIEFKCKVFIFLKL